MALSDYDKLCVDDMGENFSEFKTADGVVSVEMYKTHLTVRDRTVMEEETQGFKLIERPFQFGINEGNLSYRGLEINAKRIGFRKNTLIAVVQSGKRAAVMIGAYGHREYLILWPIWTLAYAIFRPIHIWVNKLRWSWLDWLSDRLFELDGHLYHTPSRWTGITKGDVRATIRYIRELRKDYTISEETEQVLTTALRIAKRANQGDTFFAKHMGFCEEWISTPVGEADEPLISQAIGDVADKVGTQQEVTH